jgi:hypothetical protein
MAEQQRVNCHVQSMANGGRRLVFTLEGSNKNVGEIAVQGDLRYLLAMAQMFTQWANMERDRAASIILPPSPGTRLRASIRHALNGHSLGN